MIRLEVPGELRFRGVVMRTVAAACRLARGESPVEHDAESDEERLDLSHDLDAKLVSAVSEAYNNIVLHAYKDTNPGKVVLEIDTTADAITARLLDTGASFDADAAREPDLDSLPEGGLGLFIIQSFVDQFEYTPGSPNVWSMTKSYSGLARPGAT